MNKVITSQRLIQGLDISSKSLHHYFLYNLFKFHAFLYNNIFLQKLVEKSLNQFPFLKWKCLKTLLGTRTKLIIANNNIIY